MPAQALRRQRERQACFTAFRRPPPRSTPQIPPVVNPIDQFIHYLETERRASPATLDTYARALRAFAAYMADEEGGAGMAGNKAAVAGEDESKTNEAALQKFAPAVVTTADVRGWVMRLVESGAAPSGVNNKLSALNSFFRYLIRQGLTDKNPATSLKQLKTGRTLPHFVEQSRMNTLADVLAEPSGDYPTERDAVIILLLYSCGLRRSELASLSVSNIDPAAHTIRVMGKGAKERELPLIPLAEERIAHYLTVRETFIAGDGQNEAHRRAGSQPKVCTPGEKALFLSDKGKPITAAGVYAIVRQALEKAGVQGKRSPHVLRHTFATHLMQHGASVRTVQKLLGHESLAATEIYTHNTIESLKESYRKAHPRAKGAGKT